MSLINLRHSSLDRSNNVRSQMHSKSSLSIHRPAMNQFSRTSASGFGGINSSGPSFVFKSFEVPGDAKKIIDYGRLLKKPNHKPKVIKFDKDSVTQERTTSVLTKEDNFDKFDMPWISKLRVRDNAEIVRMYSKDKKIESTSPAPPSFYETDLTKTRKNTKLHNVDFNCRGNSNEYQHLIKPGQRGPATKSEINFGFGLRKYRSQTGLNNEKPFIFPGLKDTKKPFAAPQPSGSLTKRGSAQVIKLKLTYNDKFPQQNTNSIRHLFDKTSQIGTVSWGASLRWNNDSQMHLRKRIKTSPKQSIS